MIEDTYNVMFYVWKPV